MEIAIEAPNGEKRSDLIPHINNEENCLFEKACQNGGICRNTSFQADGTIRRGVCICPLGYLGSLCTESEYCLKKNNLLLAKR